MKEKSRLLKSKEKIKNFLAFFKNKKSIRQFFFFAIIGAFGMAINLTILYSLTEVAKIHYVKAGAVSFIVSATINYTLNKKVTFREKLRYMFFKKYGKFLSISVSTLLLNLSLLYFFTEFLRIYYVMSEAIAISIGFLFNFTGNKKWTFKD